MANERKQELGFGKVVTLVNGDELDMTDKEFSANQIEVLADSTIACRNNEGNTQTVNGTVYATDVAVDGLYTSGGLVMEKGDSYWGNWDKVAVAGTGALVRVWLVSK